MASLELKNVRIKGEILSTRVNYLPWETIFEILLRLPVESLIQCKLVCKTWYAIIKDPRFIDLHLTLSVSRHYVLFGWDEDTQSCYSLVEEEENKWRALSIVDNNLLHLGLTNNFDGTFFVAGSCNGLLCISPDREFLDPIFICNLFTRECVKLPATTEPIVVIHPWNQNVFVMSKTDPLLEVYHQEIGFGYDLLTKRYKLVRVFKTNPFGDDTDPYGEIMTMGDSAWRTLKFPYPIVLSTQSETLVFEGSFYWFIKRKYGRPCLHDILAFDIADEKFSTLKFPPYMKVRMGGVYPVLMNHRGLLTLVAVDLWYIISIWQLMNNGWTCQCTMIEGIHRPAVDIKGTILLWVKSKGFHLYDTIKKQAFKLEVSEVPSSSFQISSFVPSLVSPKAIINSNSH